MRLRHTAVAICTAGLLTSGSATAYAWTATTALAPPTCHGQRATVVGTDGDDQLTGTRHRDVIVAKSGNDAIDARGGDDLICAGEGSDTIAGGDGADRIFAGRGIDMLMGGAGRDRLFGQRDGVSSCDDDGCLYSGDTLVGGSGNDYFDGGDFIADDTVTYTASAVPIRVDADAGTIKTGVFTDHLAPRVDQSVKGSRYADRMLGSARGDSFAGGRGDDRLIGRGGADGLAGESGDNVVDGGPGNDSLGGFDGDNTVDGGDGSDEIVVSDGDDVVRAGAGNDWIYTAGGVGVDRVLGGLGDDAFNFYVPDAGDYLDAGPGRDSLFFEWSLDGVSLDLEAATLTAPVRATVAAFEMVHATSGPDTIGGSAADEGFVTYDGDDTVMGRGGDDAADMGTGNDTCSGVEQPTSCENVS